MRSASRASSALVLVLLLGAVGIGYGHVLDAPFVFDDVRNVSENPALVATEPGLEGLRRAALASPTPRPTAYLSFAANAWSGAGPRGYRLVNLALHVLNGWLVFALARRLYRKGASLSGVPAALAEPRVQLACAALAAIVFVAHPLQIQAVTYIVQRMTSLATALGLGALLLWLRSDDLTASRQRLARCAALLLFALACGAKEIALVLPASLWLLEASFGRDFERRWMGRTALPLALFGFAGLGAIVYGTDIMADYAAQPFTLGERLLSAPRILWLYASWVVWPEPSRLNLLHDVAVSKSLLDPATTWIAGLALLALIVGAALAARRYRFAAFAALWFLLHLALETSIPPLALAFEHRLYLPLVGCAIALPPLLLRATGGRAQPALGIGFVLCVGLLAATVARNEVWRDVITLWEDTARKSPNSAMALDELGLALGHAGRLTEAKAVLTRATSLVPRRAEAFAHLGWVEGQLGEPKRQQTWLRRAIEIDPSYPRAHYALGLALREDEPEAALASLARAAALAPGDSHYGHAYAEALARSGRLAEAGDAWQAVLEIAPRNAAAHTGLARLARAQGRDDVALFHFERAFALDPASPITRNNLAWLRATSSDARVRDAKAAWQLAAPLRDLPPPPDPATLDTVAAALAAVGRFAEAAETAERAAALAQAAGEATLARDIATRAARYEAETQRPRDE